MREYIKLKEYCRIKGIDFEQDWTCKKSLQIQKLIIFNNKF